MRTTLTLEEDVAVMLRRLQREDKKGFKQLVNEILRLGLIQREKPSGNPCKYSTPELNPGSCLYPDLDNTADILAALAMEHGLILCSTDRDFSIFPGLKWENPLAGK